MKNREEKLLLILLIHTGEGAHIGTTKPTSGTRDIPFGDCFKELLLPFRSKGYVFGGEQPFQSWDYDKLMRRLKNV